MRDRLRGRSITILETYYDYNKYVRDTVCNAVNSSIQLQLVMWFIVVTLNSFSCQVIAIYVCSVQEV